MFLLTDIKKTISEWKITKTEQINNLAKKKLIIRWIVLLKMDEAYALESTRINIDVHIVINNRKEDKIYVVQQSFAKSSSNHIEYD